MSYRIKNFEDQTRWVKKDTFLTVAVKKMTINQNVAATFWLLVFNFDDFQLS